MPQARDHFEQEKPFLDDDHHDYDRHVTTRKSRGRHLVVVPWILSVVSWLVTIYVLISRGNYDILSGIPKANLPLLSEEDHQQQQQQQQQPENTTFWPTDFEALRSSITYESRVFTGALYWDTATAKFYRNKTEDGLEFVGPPSEAIDAAWETLLEHEWIPMTEQEAAAYTPTLKTFNGMYRFEPDVFHSLHCLNQVRKKIDFEYYTLPEHSEPPIDQEDWDRIHIDHCLDQLRQTIMCAGDLSPVPLFSWEGAPLGIGQGTTHTCRKWEPIRKWADQRRIDLNDPL